MFSIIVAALATFSVLNGLISCQSNAPEEKEVAAEPIKSQDVLRVSEGRDFLAQLLAQCFSQEDVASELTDLFFQEKDGDSEFLLAEILPNEEGMRSHSSISKGLSEAYQRLQANKGLRDVTALPMYFKSFEQFAGYLRSQDPLIQVSLLGATRELDLRTDRVLVVSLPEDFDDTQAVSLRAYDNRGYVFHLKSDEIPSCPIIAVSRNERLIAIPHSASTQNIHDLGSLYYTDNSYRYYFRKDLVMPDYHAYSFTNQEGCDRSENGAYYEYLEKAQFTSQSALRHYENFFLGKPEIKFTVIPVKASELKTIGECTSDGWGKGAMKDLGIRLFQWDRDALGEQYLVHWIELDGTGFIKEITPTISGKLFGINLGLGFKIVTESGDDEIGGCFVSYTDPALNSMKYQVGQYFNFWVKIAPLQQD